MKLGNVVHLAVDVQNRFLFPPEIGFQHHDIGGREFLQQMLSFNRALADCNVPVIWVASRNRRIKTYLSRNRAADDRRAVIGRHDFPAILQENFRGMVSLKSADSAFSNPALLRRLRRMGVTTLLISGLYAGQCVRATARDASATGFHCRIVSDLTLDNRSGDTAAHRRQRLVEIFTGHPQIEITDAAAILRALRGADKSGVNSPPLSAPAIILGRHAQRILLHQFRQESRHSGRIMFDGRRPPFAAAVMRDNADMNTASARKNLLHSFQAIQDEVV